MEELVILKILESGALADGKGCRIEVETHAGPRELRFTFEDAARLIAALETAQRELQRRRARSGAAPLPEKPKVPERWETGIDPVNQLAVLRACFADDTTSEAAIPRQQIPQIAEFLHAAMKRLEPGTDMRQ